MAMEEGVGIAEDFQVHPKEVRIAIGANRFHGLAEDGHALQELGSLGSGQVRQLARRRVVGEQHAIAWQPLHIAHYRKSRRYLFEDRGILTAQR